MNTQQTRPREGWRAMIVGVIVFVTCSAGAILYSTNLVDNASHTYEIAKDIYFTESGITFPVDGMSEEDQLDYIRDSRGYEKQYQVKADLEALYDNAYAPLYANWFVPIVMVGLGCLSCILIVQRFG